MLILIDLVFVARAGKQLRLLAVEHLRARLKRHRLPRQGVLVRKLDVDVHLDAAELVHDVLQLGEMHLLELYHGPTSAFKDVALSMLPQLMSKALAGTGKKIMIATATSGDTGKAALAGFKDVPGIGISVFYPEGGVSAIQELQMSTQEGKNVAVSAVNGNFDDAQTAVKKLFSSDAVAELAALGVSLSSANSINVGRLVPQIVYYFDAYKQLMEQGVLRAGDPIDFTVPTGNFGDVLAGYCAKRMGLPVRHLVVASNANNVLTAFLTTGVYDRRRDLVKTISPSMDILVEQPRARALLDRRRECREDARAHEGPSDRRRLPRGCGTSREASGNIPRELLERRRNEGRDPPRVGR